MLLLTLLLVPLVGILIILTSEQARVYNVTGLATNGEIALSENVYKENTKRTKQIKQIALSASIINLIISLVIFILFDFSSNQFQFVQEYHEVSYFHIYLGLDGLSIYFVLLTTIITPISLLSN
jgi:NADH:ubiquinone oxidoreductase subunit 4 (subunit M)